MSATSARSPASRRRLGVNPLREKSAYTVRGAPTARPLRVTVSSRSRSTLVPTWRRLHYLSFVAFFGATAHGLMAGSDTGADWVFLGYLAMTTMVVFLFVYRIVLSLAQRRGSRVAVGAGTTALETHATTR